MIQLFVAEERIREFANWCHHYGIEIAPMARYFHEHPNKIRYDIYGASDMLMLAKLTWSA